MKRRILVIDDNKVLIRTLTEGLQREGFEVLTETDGAAGMEAASRRAPDVILCDLHLEAEDGSDGLEFLRRLRANPATMHLPLVLMSGHFVEEERARVSKSGADGFLVKPFALKAALAAVRSCLEKARPAESGAAAVQAVAANAGRGETSRREPVDALSARFRSMLEKERSRVARAIHDDLTQTLTVLALELSLLEGALAGSKEALPVGECRTRVRKLCRLVGGAIESAQEITAGLRPKVLDEFGLIAALEWFAHDFEKRTGIRSAVRFPEKVSLAAGAEEEVYRLAQEIFDNVAQHSRASRVEIRVDEEETGLLLEVRDNGRGITAREASGPGSLGLLALRERAAALGGSVSVSGRAGRGTSVVVRIPSSGKGERE